MREIVVKKQVAFFVSVSLEVFLLPRSNRGEEGNGGYRAREDNQLINFADNIGGGWVSTK